METYISYLRVSTRKQGRSGLGIEAQRSTVAAYVGDNRLLAEYVEIESGTRDDRTELQNALRHAKATSSTLICAKLDRIGRKASHVLGLLESANVPVVFADSPSATKLSLGILAVVAEEEARAISERTTAGLAAAKARGVKLGNPNGAAVLRRYEALHGHRAATEGRIKAADDFAEGLRFAIEDVVADGTTSTQEIAVALNANGFPTRRGKSWSRRQVSRLLNRLQIDLIVELPNRPYMQTAKIFTHELSGGLHASCPDNSTHARA